jgi:PAS domain-containing protein
MPTSVRRQWTCWLHQQHRYLERKRPSAARAKEEWERTFDSVPDLIAILDTKFRVVRANRALADASGNAGGASGSTAIRWHGTKKPPFSAPMPNHQRWSEHVEGYERLGGDFVVSTTPLRDIRADLSHRPRRPRRDRAQAGGEHSKADTD